MRTREPLRSRQGRDVSNLHQTQPRPRVVTEGASGLGCGGPPLGGGLGVSVSSSGVREGCQSLVCVCVGGFSSRCCRPCL